MLRMGNQLLNHHPRSCLVAQDYEEPMGFLLGNEVKFPFAAIYRCQESDLENYLQVLGLDRIYYIDGGERDGKDRAIEIGATNLEWLSCNVDEESNNQAACASFTWAQEVEAINTSCTVIEHPADSSSDFITYMIHPYVYTTQDFLLVILKAEGDERNATRERVLQIAQSVELNDP